MSPTVLRVGAFRMSFYSADEPEPPHVHVRAGGGEAKFWLGPPVRVAWASGLSRRELARAQRAVEAHRNTLEEAWHGYFGT